MLPIWAAERTAPLLHGLLVGNAALHSVPAKNGGAGSAFRQCAGRRAGSAKVEKENSDRVLALRAAPYLRSRCFLCARRQKTLHLGKLEVEIDSNPAKKYFATIFATASRLWLQMVS